MSWGAAPLLPLESSHSFATTDLFGCESSSGLPSSSVLASKSSIYVTFKVLHLVHAFRKRVKTRVQSAKKAAPKKVVDSFCQDFERQAFDEIDRYLGRKTAHPRWKPKIPTKRIATVTEEDPPKSIDWLLERINQAVKSETSSLTTVASNNRLFVQRKGEFTISAKRLSVKGLTELVVVVNDLLKTLKQLPPSHFGTKTLCEGHEVLDLHLDETYIANLEHLLLCLKEQLIRLLLDKLVEVVHKHVIECQRNQGRHSENWFFEFPDARHPLSTTWPWSIRPSLAVLWGVCWMFIDLNGVHIDEHGNMVNGQGEIIVESQDVERFFNNPHRQQQGYYPPANPSQASMPRHQHPRLPRAISHSHSSGAVAAPHPLNTHRPTSFSNANVEPTQGTTGLHLHNTYTEAQPVAYSSYADPASVGNVHNWLPEDGGFATGLGFESNAYPATTLDTWQSLTPQRVPQQPTGPVYSQALPPRTRNSLTPIISVTTDFQQNSGGFHHQQQQPQDIYTSATTHSSSSPIPQQHDSYNPNLYNPDHLSPLSPRYMTSDQQQRMQTPPRSPAVDESNPRKRSHSVMSGDAQAPNQPQISRSRSNSAASYQNHSLGEESSPRNRSIKRPDPPMNAEHKYICDHAPECVGITFDRKCEWSKHMDKHDRPYRCSHSQCAKLQGFTYSGGLLRHEREVHGKHGGPKAQLMCPHEDCKRHSGKGFTRRENLNEHLRRVHQSKDQLQSQPYPLKRDATDAFGGADEGDTPASDAATAGHDDAFVSPTTKRRRHTFGLSERSASEDMEDLKAEIKRLMDENAAKDARLMTMEIALQEERESRREEYAALQESIRVLQEQRGQGQT